jgi:hypothetical protein
VFRARRRYEGRRSGRVTGDRCRLRYVGAAAWLARVASRAERWIKLRESLSAKLPIWSWAFKAVEIFPNRAAFILRYNLAWGGFVIHQHSLVVRPIFQAKRMTNFVRDNIWVSSDPLRVRDGVTSSVLVLVWLGER